MVPPIAVFLFPASSCVEAAACPVELDQFSFSRQDIPPRPRVIRPFPRRRSRPSLALHWRQYGPVLANAGIRGGSFVGNGGRLACAGGDDHRHKRTKRPWTA